MRLRVGTNTTEIPSLGESLYNAAALASDTYRQKQMDKEQSKVRKAQLDAAQQEMAQSKRFQTLAEKVKSGRATDNEAASFALMAGGNVTEFMREYVPREEGDGGGAGGLTTSNSPRPPITGKQHKAAQEAEEKRQKKAAEDQLPDPVPGLLSTLALRLQGGFADSETPDPTGMTRYDYSRAVNDYHSQAMRDTGPGPLSGLAAVAKELWGNLGDSLGSAVQKAGQSPGQLGRGLESFMTYPQDSSRGTAGGSTVEAPDAPNAYDFSGVFKGIPKYFSDQAQDIPQDLLQTLETSLQAFMERTGGTAEDFLEWLNRNSGGVPGWTGDPQGPARNSAN